MIIVSFFTPDYAEHAANLRRSCRRFGQRCWIEQAVDSGVWVENCARKGRFMQRALLAAGEAVLWLDADAEIRQGLASLEPRDADFAVHRTGHKLPKWAFRSGTVWFNQTPAAIQLASDWAQMCADSPKVYDQELLYRAWQAQPETLRTHWLDLRWCQTFDEAGADRDNAAIVHNQASRQLRHKGKRCRPRT